MPAMPDPLGFKEAPETTSDFIIVPDCPPSRSVEIRDAALPEETTHGFTDGYPTPPTATSGDEVAVNESPADDRLVAVGVSDRRLQDDASQSGKRLPDEPALLPSESVVPEGSGRIAKAKRDSAIFRATSSQESGGEISEEVLVAGRQMRSSDLPKRMAV